MGTQRNIEKLKLKVVEKLKKMARIQSGVQKIDVENNWFNT